MNANRRLAVRAVAALVLGSALVAGGAAAVDLTPDHGQALASRTYNHAR